MVWQRHEPDSVPGAPAALRPGALVTTPLFPISRRERLPGSTPGSVMIRPGTTGRGRQSRLKAATPSSG